MEKELPPCQIKKSRRSSKMRLTVSCQTGVILTVPWGVSQNLWQDFLDKNKDWILGKLKLLEEYKNQGVFLPTTLNYKNNKAEALNLARRKVKEWNNFFSFQVGNIRVKNHKTLWGSCSRKGNLNFNFRIIYLPPNLLDYLVVHELCHLKEMNHSKKFWQLVATCIPDYKKLRQELKRIRIT